MSELGDLLCKGIKPRFRHRYDMRSISEMDRPLSSRLRLKIEAQDLPNETKYVESLPSLFNESSNPRCDIESLSEKMIVIPGKQ